jgi:hypothetical protein
LILGKRRKSQRARSGEQGGWGTTGIFSRLKIPEWKGQCAQERCRDGGAICHFRKVEIVVF